MPRRPTPAAEPRTETWTCVVCGFTKQVGANRWARIRASTGWYSTRDEQMRFCPDHCPPFAAEYGRRP